MRNFAINNYRFKLKNKQQLTQIIGMTFEHTRFDYELFALRSSLFLGGSKFPLNIGYEDNAK